MELLVTDVRPWGAPVTSLAVRDGRFVEPAALSSHPPVVSAEGAIALPSLTNAHVHPDKTLWRQQWLSRPPMTLLDDFIGFDLASRAGLEPDVETRSWQLLADAVATGTRAVRAHVDVAPAYGLANVTGVRRAADRLSDGLDVQIVAFPQLGVRRLPGTAELLREAIGAGADIVGGLDPWSLAGEDQRQLDDVVAIAHDAGCEIDIHLHDGGPDGVRRVQEIAQRAASDGLAGRVTVSHGFGLGDVPVGELTTTLDALVAADVAVATCVHGDVSLLPHAELLAAGVRVGLGTDGIRDAWSPLGSPDMLERVLLLAYRTGVASDDELADLVAFAAGGGEQIMRREPAGLDVGRPADFFLVPGANVAQVVVDHPVREAVFVAGRRVASAGVLEIDD